MTEVDNRSMTDCNSSPLDLSLKSSKINDPNHSGDLTESLKELIRLQTKISVPTNEDLLISQTYSNSPSISDPTISSLTGDNFPMNSREWIGLCQNPFLMNQMLAKLGGLGNFSTSLPTNTTDFPIDSLKVQLQSNASSLGKKKFLPNRFKCDSFIPTVAPPEAFGISMRGNQKYSAYYQRPFILPFGASAKNSLSETNCLKKSHVTDKKSACGNKKVCNQTSIKETAFKCSCGEEFENLYIFTLHMKESNHSPKSESSERDIPKLVRGQDMWINSEIEQTREILRCMHCQQSFRTLPDLTMHMIKTSHFSEIVYSDSGRCLFLNSDQNLKASDNSRSGEKRSSQHLKSGSPSLIKGNAKLNAIRPKKMPRLKMEEPIDNTLTNGDTQLKSPSEKGTCASIYSDVINDPDNSAESNGSAKPDSSCKEYISEKSDLNIFSSVITQIENFVEKSLPKSTQKFKNHSVTLHDVDKICTTRSKSNLKNEKTESRSYIAPEEDDKTGESPLSSLQKLVDTTSKSNISSLHRRSPVPTPTSSEKEDISTTKFINTHESSQINENDTPKSLLPNNIPPFLMLNSSLYQPKLLNNDQLSLLGNLYSIYPGLSHSISQDILQRVNPHYTISDLSTQSHLENSHSSPSERNQNYRQSTENASTKEKSEFSTKSSVMASSSNATPLVQVKKSKCNYCGKPFANKGQVRLHVSKGKCPSLMQRCHSTSLASAMLTANPFSYLSLGRS